MWTLAVQNSDELMVSI